MNASHTPLHSIQEALAAGVESLQLSELQFSPEMISFEKPADASHGDWATTIALSLFQSAKAAGSQAKNPRELAEEIVVGASRHGGTRASWFESLTVAGPGFINVTLSDEFYVAKMVEMAQTHAKIPSEASAVKTAIVEYSSPNIAKPFTIGHLRSTIIGDAVANLLEAVGYQVLRDNHLGDWGTQFGKQIYAIKHLGLGSEEKNIEYISASENPVKELVKLYVEFHEKAELDPSLEDSARAWFTRLEQGDQEARALWQQCIDWSFVQFERIYQRLGVSFHDGFAGGRGLGESFFEDKMGAVLTQLEEKLAPVGQYQDSKGAKLVFFPNEELPPLMILKQDGSTLYATRDLATDLYRLQQFGSDILIINEVGAEQSLYFKQIYRTEELLGWFKPEQRVHVKHGLYSFKDKKMSTRKGNVIWLEDVLSEAEARAAALAKEKNPASTPAPAATNAAAISIGALKWNDLKRSAHLNVTFDWDEILNMQGNSGPYMQYTYVRTRSILSKAESMHALQIDILLNGAMQFQKRYTTDERKILRLLAEYFDIVRFAASEYAPHHLCTYLYELAQAFNTFYNKEQVLEVEDGTLTQSGRFRIALTATVGMVLQNGLQILGIETVDRM
jgi:arginyl-tRNA synthetase